MRRRTIVYGSALLVLLAAADLGGLVRSALADGFTTEDINGGYGFSFSGSFIGDSGTSVPVSAVGQFTADNAVVDDLTRTLNLGGVALVDSIFAGIATVDPNGRGVAAFCGINTVRAPSPPELYPAKTLEMFEFVLTGRKSSEIEVISSGVFELEEDFDLNSCPLPDDPPVGTPLSGVIIGIARKQDEDRRFHRDDDDDD